MEEVGNEWRCPKCVEETNRAKEDAQQAELQRKLKEREEIAKEAAQAKKQKSAISSPAKKSFKRSNSSKSLEGPKDDKVGRTILALHQSFLLIKSCHLRFDLGVFHLTQEFFHVP